MIAPILLVLSLAQASQPAAAPVDLSTTTAEALAQAADIDGELAQAVVALRDERGSLASLEALRVLPGMDDAALGKLRHSTIVTLDLPVKKQRRAWKSVDEVLGQFDDEPNIADVQQMAMRYSHTHRSQVESWLAASKNAPKLPEFQFRYYYYDRWNTGYNTEAIDKDPGCENVPDDADSDKDHVYQLTLKWRLDELMMSSERIRVISESQDVVKLRDKVLGEVTRIYFDRRRLQVDSLLAPSSGIKSQVEDQLRLMELTAELDAFTGGEFSRALSSR